MDLKKYDIWFVTGSQNLYGPETLQQVERNSREIANYFNKAGDIPVNIVHKPVMTTPDTITGLCIDANADTKCIGIITWCHTFSPSKMWINGLKRLNKPVLHLHTQFNRDLPWNDIDMDYMNLHQAAHGDREHGFIMSRLRINRKVVVGHWQDDDVTQQLGIWTRAAAGWHAIQNLKVARFGDNMREVAVTEGDKIEAQIKFGMSVNSYGVGDIVKVVNDVTDAEIDKLVEEYGDLYDISAEGRKGGNLHHNVRYQARLELALKSFLTEGGFGAYTDTFEDLHGLEQLPGLATQRLMAAGFGFGAEGDWKQSALVRAFKVMATGLEGGTSFMEDYTYHLDPAGVKVLGAHMLEICPSIASSKPKLEVHPLGIGGKDDPARLVFDTASGPAINACLVDMGNRFRMVVNAVDCVPSPPLPKLPVARVVWQPQPDLKTGAACWIHAGGAHHASFSQALTAEYITDFCEMAGIECLVIDDNTNLRDFKNELRWNEMYYGLSQMW